MRSLVLAALALASLVVATTTALGGAGATLLAEPLGPDPIDPRFGRASVPRAQRPQNPRFGGCSLRAAVCVHATKDVTPELAARTLSAAENALFGLRALNMPPPLFDGQLGPTHGFDVYIDPTARGARALDDAAILGLGRDTTSAFAIVPTAGRGASCALEHDVTRAIAQASLLGIDAAVHDATLAVSSTAFASLLAPCPALELEAIDRWQRRPEHALSCASASEPTGALLWSSYLDHTFGFGKPGLLLPGLVAIGSQRTPHDSAVWHDEPDDYDVLRLLLPFHDQSFDDALLGFAISRAFVGSRSDEAHLIDVAKYGDFGRVRIDWSVTLASLPRRVRLRELEPTGAAYVWLALDGRTPLDRLTAVAECEESFAFRWALVTVDADGRELGRHTGGRFGEPRTQLTLEKLSGAAVLVVAAAIGRDDRARPFDADDGEPQTAVCELTLYRQ
ncbi:MAG: hypothetical protein EXR75_09900 [Myxococcales bacterium]|nr:hypothetical protein [Myxococcales bacterium]